MPTFASLTWVAAKGRLQLPHAALVHPQHRIVIVVQQRAHQDARIAQLATTTPSM
jgi:hypothetical protein